MLEAVCPRLSPLQDFSEEAYVKVRQGSRKLNKSYRLTKDLILYGPNHLYPTARLRPAEADYSIDAIKRNGGRVIRAGGFPYEQEIAVMEDSVDLFFLDGHSNNPDFVREDAKTGQELERQYLFYPGLKIAHVLRKQGAFPRREAVDYEEVDLLRRNDKLVLESEKGKQITTLGLQSISAPYNQQVNPEY
jgi:hypothetical protein